MNIFTNIGTVGILVIALGLGGCVAPTDASPPSDDKGSVGEATDDLGSLPCCYRCQVELDDCTPPPLPPVSNLGYCWRAYKSCTSACWPATCVVEPYN
jgi:hypothetical protein